MALQVGEKEIILKLVQRKIDELCERNSTFKVHTSTEDGHLQFELIGDKIMQYDQVSMNFTT